MLPSHIHRSHSTTIALVATTRTVEVTTTSTLGVIVRSLHRPPLLTTSRTVPACAPRIHPLEVDVEEVGLVLDEVKQLTASPRTNRPRRLSISGVVFELPDRFEDDFLASVEDSQPYEFVRHTVLDLPAETALSPPRLAILTQQVLEPLRVILALPPQLREAVVDALHPL